MVRSRTVSLGTLLTLFAGDSTFAAITAVIAANVVLAGYIFLSMQEERQTNDAAKAKNGHTIPPETKKTQ